MQLSQVLYFASGFAYNGLSMEAALIDREFAQLVHDVVKIPNPQNTDEATGRAGEADLMDWIVAWLKQRNIQCEYDYLWGVHASIGSAELPGVLLSAHLDSDHLRVGDCSNIVIRGNDLWIGKGEVGLDDKTGVAICLSVLERLLAGQVLVPYHVHVMFTVGEESGQKGAIRCPLARLIGRKVRHALVIDRQTRGSSAPTKPNGRPLRHAVSSYKDVPLMDPDSKDEMVNCLTVAMRAVGELGDMETIALIESPNNADALEWRGRWDADVVAPILEGQYKFVSDAWVEYLKTTEKVKIKMANVEAGERVSGMYHEPRRSRYQAMKKMRDAIAKVKITDKELWFSTCNLSYDYDDYDSAVSLVELDTTALIVLGFIDTFFAAFSEPGGEDLSKKPEAQLDVLVVSCAGHADANGKYVRGPTHVQKGGRPVWTHEMDDKYKIQWSDLSSVWMIDCVGGPAPYRMEGGDGALPLGGTWVTYQRSGVPPNPVVAPMQEQPPASADGGGAARSGGASLGYVGAG
eukprot:TRINITY_DN62418_c0_g1_i1.p1 TRINITY_DN62418_c0_g1~~TRINITY_DN62418_c0_g1_i1.p1  ORF type:complete len:519 (-),score=68.01 TRINITY_DN62418_c0_g1_i1:64-1620(-)